MTKAEITKMIRELIANGHMDEALEALSQYVNGVDRYAENDVLMQTANFNRNRRDREKGLISGENYQMMMARLDYGVSQILERIPEEGNEIDVNMPPPANGPKQHAAQNTTPTTAGIRKILFLSANPKDQANLRLGEELRKIKDGLRGATNRDDFVLESESAVRINTITLAMQQHRPEIVHFSGHGYGETGLVVENDAGQSVMFPTIGLDRLFRLFQKNVKCVVLNACYAVEQAKVISQHGIYVVGMNKAISDKAAIDFSVGFYQSIGEGNDPQFAFEIALINVSANLKDADAPELWYNGERVFF